MGDGRVTAIYVRPEKGGSVSQVEAVLGAAGQGLEGDHAFNGDGPVEREGRDLTLIEGEALEWFAAEKGIQLEEWEPRRNLVTRGVRLNDLVGQRFTVGEIECVGRLLCEPCATLEKRTQPGVLKGLVHRGGVRADIVAGGRIRVGDVIRASG